MAISLKSVLRYWRAALLDSLRHIDPGSLELYSCEHNPLARGRIEGEALEGVWHDAQEGLSKKEREDLRQVPVLIALQILEPEIEHSAAYSTLKKTRVPLWLPARVDREGKLFPAGAPMVDRAVLAPLSTATMTFTTVDAVDAYLGDNPPPGEEAEWAAAWKHAVEMFGSLFGGAPHEWVPERHVGRGAFIGWKNPPIDTSRAVRETFEAVIDGKEAVPPPLLAKLVETSSAREIATSADGATALRQRHLGQMGGEFSLNPSQREALGAMLAVKEGELLAVNGPPGTGKTTFIQSVVASLWVESVLVENGEPPVILASSTNNKAITNILDCFARATLPAGHALANSPLVRRWLPDFHQYGLYLPSQREADKGIRKDLAAAWCAKNGQPWSGLPGRMETQDYVTRAEAHWRAQFALWAGRETGDMADAVGVLRRSLITKIDAIKEVGLLRASLSSSMLSDEALSPASMKRLRERLPEMRSEVEALRRQGHDALQLLQGSLIEFLLSWLPPVKQRLWGRAYTYLDAQGLADPSWTWGTPISVHSFRSWLDDRVKRSESYLDAAAKSVEVWDGWSAELSRLLPNLDIERAISDGDAVEAALDIEVRPELFHLAARYWEGRWLIEMAQAIERNDKTFTGRNREMCERRWRRFAKLTPCLVGTAFTAPRLFDYYSGETKRLFGFIDLLIVDEAGQVPPQVGAALFAFSRRALVVGDIQQLEPVWGIDAATDGGNLTLHGLEGDRPELDDRGMLVSEGSIMAVAQSATAFASKPHRGLFLNEHWRCRPQVIAYCNELAYRGALKPMRPDARYPLPALGYAHILGAAKRSGLSWTNAAEAVVISRWLQRRKAGLIAQHDAAKLGDVVAIVTPFRAQIRILRQALADAELDGEDITVGTVHTLQGAEKHVVLFSAVYSADRAGGLFFDRGVSMLNVAVSRARESFLVFGDMRLFKPAQSSLPSGLLARYLFADPENEITDIDPTGRLSLKAPSDLERLSDLDAHCGVLRRAIVEANQQVLVVSPYLSNLAIEADGLSSLIESRIGGPRIVVAYDRHLNIGRDQRLQPRAAAALEVLAKAGVELWALDGAHNKTLAVDESWIVEGSFNWLSAVRDRRSDYQRHEASLLYRGLDASTHVASAWREAEALRTER